MSTLTGLVIRELTVRFGGLLAVNGIDLEVRVGSLVGLIGPNGAGKTTTFNAITGLERASAGTVELFGRDISKLASPTRAQLGLGRTFQRMELFDSLTVAENVSLGCEGSRAGSNALRQIVGKRGDRDAVSQATQESLEMCGLSELASQQVGVLSTGKRRLVELARVLAGPFRILLLDEPSSGLDDSETERFGEILTSIVQHRGVGILLVEHDMALVNAVCSYVYVLDFGELIFQGTMADVTASDVVRAAYLGSDAA